MAADDGINDGPDTDGHDIDFTEHADDDLTQSLRPLFPDGVAHDRWHELWRDARP